MFFLIDGLSTFAHFVDLFQYSPMATPSLLTLPEEKSLRKANEAHR